MKSPIYFSPYINSMIVPVVFTTIGCIKEGKIQGLLYTLYNEKDKCCKHGKFSLEFKTLSDFLEYEKVYDERVNKHYNYFYTPSTNLFKYGTSKQVTNCSLYVLTQYAKNKAIICNYLKAGWEVHLVY